MVALPCSHASTLRVLEVHTTPPDDVHCPVKAAVVDAVHPKLVTESPARVHEPVSLDDWLPNHAQELRIRGRRGRFGALDPLKYSDGEGRRRLTSWRVRSGPVVVLPSKSSHVSLTLPTPGLAHCSLRTCALLDAERALNFFSAYFSAQLVAASPSSRQVEAICHALRPRTTPWMSPASDHLNAMVVPLEPPPPHDAATKRGRS